MDNEYKKILKTRNKIAIVGCIIVPLVVLFLGLYLQNSAQEEQPIIDVALLHPFATIDSVWQEHDVVENHLRGMSIHIKFNVLNMQNRRG